MGNSSECLTCQFAYWQKTKSGKLHPSGNGRCTFEPRIPIPEAKKWVWELSLSYGFINRKEEVHDCKCYKAKAVSE